MTNVSYLWKTLEFLGTPAKSGDDSSATAIGAYQAAQVLFPSWARTALLSQKPNGFDPGSTAYLSSLPAEFIDFVREDIAGLDPVSATSLLTWRLFLGERCLKDTDTMSMGVSLEVRAPFTDHILVEKVLGIPGTVRCAGAPDKPFEGTALAPYLDGAWQPRGKQGFVLPFRHWLSEASSQEEMRQVLTDRSSLRRAGLDAAAVESLRKRHAAEPASVPWSRVWALYTLVDWCGRSDVSL